MDSYNFICIADPQLHSAVTSSIIVNIKFYEHWQVFNFVLLAKPVLFKTLEQLRQVPSVNVIDVLSSQKHEFNPYLSKGYLQSHYEVASIKL